MRRDLFVYLSGPITAKDGYTVEDNVASALRVYLDCLRRGIPVFCPHLSGAFPSAHSDVPYETWMDYDFAVIDRCTHMLMLPRWLTSAGAVREMAYANDRGIPSFITVEHLLLAVDGGSVEEPETVQPGEPKSEKTKKKPAAKKGKR